MARWEPNASGRLTEAAMQLFAERGYASTTVKDIAARAGLTERTFFNCFTDKREVLFAGSAQFVKRIVDAVRAAPKSSPPFDAVVAACASTNDFFEERRPFVRKRSALLAAHPELQERELIKMMSLAAEMAAVLVERGSSPSAASIVAEAGLAIFRVGFDQWVKDAKDRSLLFHVRVARRQLEAVVGRAKKQSPEARPDPRR